MRLSTFPHVSEEYYCTNCKVFKDRIDVNKEWKCSNCENSVQIRIKTENKDNACIRVKTKELKENDLILLERNDEFRSVLNLKKENNEYRVAIEKFRVLTINEESYILKLEGGWYY